MIQRFSSRRHKPVQSFPAERLRGASLDILRGTPWPSAWSGVGVARTV